MAAPIPFYSLSGGGGYTPGRRDSYLERGGVTGVGFITVLKVWVEDEGGDEDEGEEQAAKNWDEGRMGKDAGRGMEPGGLEPNIGKWKGDLAAAPAADRAAEAAAAWR